MLHINMQRAFWIQYTSLKVIMDKSFFFFLNNSNLAGEVFCSGKTNTALFSLSAAAQRQLATSLLAFSSHNNPSEHLNMAGLSLSLRLSICLSVCLLSLSHSLISLFKCFLFILSSQHKYLPATSEQS